MGTRAATRPRRFARVVAMAGVIGLQLGCAGYRAPNAPGPMDEPRASWQISTSEDASGRPEVICRSDADAPCVLEASVETQPMFVTVSIYLYPGDAQTTYKGAVLSS